MDTTRRRRGFVKRLSVALGIAAVLLPTLGYVGIAITSAHVLTQPSNRRPDRDPKLFSPDATAWSTTTEDRLTLRGWYLPTADHERLVVVVHGMGDNWTVRADVGAALHRRGFDVLLFDLRGHGASDPARLSMGRRERADLRAVLAWAAGHGFPPGRVGWLGYSLGASTILMEGAENPDLRAAALDSPFGNLPELLDDQLTEHSGLPRCFNPGILAAADWVFGIPTDDLVPVRSARRWRDRPTLLIHGEADTIVPVAQGRALARALGPSCEAVFVPGARHIEACYRDQDAYLDRLERFFRANLGAHDDAGPASASARQRRPSNSRSFGTAKAMPRASKSADE